MTTTQAPQCTAVNQHQQGWLFGVEPEAKRGPAPRADELKGKYGGTDPAMQVLDGIVQEIGDKSYIESYTWTTPEGFGQVMSRYFRFDGCEIMRATAYALEDANFHTEAEDIMKMATAGGCAE